MKTSWLPVLLAFALLASMLSACMPMGVADCGWGATAQAWLDANKNGVRDPDDPPLSGVNFHVVDLNVVGGPVDGGGTPTNAKGDARLSVFLPGCAEPTFEIYPDIPAGYQAISNVRPTSNARSSGQVFEFGFTQLPGQATVTPRAAAPDCVSYTLGKSNRYDVVDVAVATDGTVWVATYNDGLRKLTSGSTTWVYITAKDGLVNNQVRSITPAADGSIWFATEHGASHLDAKGWTSYTEADGLISSHVYQIAISSDNVVWFATTQGVSRFDMKTSTWKSVPSEDSMTAIAVSSEGTAWASTLLAGTVSQVVEDKKDGLRFEVKTNFNFADDLAFALDGSLWIAGFDGVGRFVPADGTLDVYNSGSTNDAFSVGGKKLAFAPDGTVWIATSANPPTIYHFSPALGAENVNAWQIYDQRDGLPTLPASATNDDKTAAIAVSQTGDVWVATTEHATHCHFAGNK